MAACAYLHPLRRRANARLLRMTAALNLRIQPSQNLVELFEIAVLDVHGTAGSAMVDADAEPENIAHALFQRQRVGIFHFAAPRLLRFALRYAFVMGERLRLARVKAFLDNALRSSNRIGHTNQRSRVTRR